MNAIRYVSPDVCLPNADDRKAEPSYAEGFAAVLLFLAQMFKLLLVFLLLAVAVVLWAWGISFKSGRLYAQWVEEQEPKPTPWLMAHKLVEIILFPVMLLARWSREKVKEILHIELPLLPDSPPDSCKDILPALSTEEPSTQ